MTKENWKQCQGCHATMYLSSGDKDNKFCKDCEADNKNLAKRGPFKMVDVMDMVNKKKES